MKIVATNVVASQPPERRPTATPTARANYRTSLHETMKYPRFMDTVHKSVKCKTSQCPTLDTVVKCFIILGLLPRTNKM